MVEVAYWKTGDVLRRLGISRETLRRWRLNRGFPQPCHYRDDRRDAAYYAIEDVLEWERRVHRRRLQPPSGDASIDESVPLDAGE